MTVAVSVVVDGPGVPAWQAKAVAGLAASASLRLVSVREVAGARPGWRLHRAIERRLFRLGPDPLAPEVAPAAEVTPDGAASPDLVVWLSESAPPDGESFLQVGHGPWFEPAGRAFRRAIASGEETVETVVRVGDRVLARSVSGVRRYSATLSADAALWKAADLVVRAAERWSEATAADPDPAPPEGPPGGPSTPLFAAGSAARWGRALGIRFLYRRPWRVAVRERGPEPASGWTGEGDLVEWAPGHVYADPFLFEHDGRHHLFCEHVSPDTPRGVIAHVELREGGGAGPPVDVLAADSHLSYPFVFEHGGEIFLLPESSAARRLELHRAVDFPRAWELDTVLFEDLDVVDATPFEHDGRLWMFAAIAGRGASRLDELHLFHADGPRGPWTPHPLNPVVSDVRAGRPGGAMLREDGRLVRVGQDGSRRYGGAVSFRAVDVLTETDYAEHEVGRIDPGDVPGARAVHAYTRDSRYEAIDLRVREPRWRISRSSASM